MLQALECKESIDIPLVVSSVSDAPAVHKARDRGVEVYILEKQGRELLWERLTKELERLKIEFILLAGFMKIIPASFLEIWRHPIINIHPSLLPKYPGTNSIRRAYDEKAPIGVTIHKVVAQVDAGPVLEQEAIAYSHEEGFEKVKERVHALEHKLVRKVLTGWKNYQISS